MIIPTVHLNGTSADGLTDPLDEAISALRLAIAAVEACAPNGRDYYPQGPDAIGVATAEFRSRLDRLTAVRKELVEMREQIQDVIDRR